MKKRKLWLKVLSVVMAAVLVAASIPFFAVAEESTIRFGVVSDIHLLADSLKNHESEAYQNFVKNSHKEYNEINSLVDNALDGILRNAVENGATYVLLPGDLTKDGELESHKQLAEKLSDFEEETGIPVFVIPGNHDINNSKAVTFENGVKEAAEKTSPEQFREIYADLGYDEADTVFTPAQGNKGGMLSYTVDLGDYKLIAIDSCIYSNDNGAENNEHETAGVIGDDLLEWIVDECEDAEADNQTVVAMQHHNLIPHIEIEEATLAPFVVKDWVRIADTYADAGMHYIFTGHLHSNDVASHVSDNGETIYDILTPTLTGFPNYYKIVDFTTYNGEITLDVETKEIDEYQNVVSDNGTVHEKPYKLTYSFERTFGEGGIKDLLTGIIYPFITDLFTEISAEGGLSEYLVSKNLDLEKIIVDALGTNGLAIGDAEILTVSTNLMGFINDLLSQVDEAYINDPEGTNAKLDVILDKVLGFQLSEYPCTLTNEMLGYPLTGEGCTVGEFATSVLLVYYQGNEDVSDLAYVNDVLEKFDSGVLFEDLFNFLVNTILHDLLEDEILATLEFNPGELFPDGTVLAVLGNVLQGITETLLGGDNSFTNLIASVLGLSIIPEEYGSLDDIYNTIAGEYLTFSQFEAWGHTANWMLSSFFYDTNTADGGQHATFTYSGPVEVEVTKENYRAPSNIVLTLAEDASTGAYITWLTKYSVTASDIELVPYSTNPVFSGVPTTDSRVKASSKTVERSYPGADLGLPLPLMLYTTEYTQHVIELQNLTPGTKYCYRVGDAEKGWWSETGVIETASGDDGAFTFFYVTDPQSQREDQYATFGGVIETAAATCLDGKFIVSAGDQVDMGVHMKHWQYLLNSTDELLNLPFMPTTGNHEDEGSVITNNFTLPNVPEQELETGVFYSYDYNDTHFTVLNANDIVDDKLSDKQIEWLKNDISASNKQWKIVVIHKAVYSNGSHYDDGDVVGMRSQLSALLPSLGVDLVLQGHDHVYLRTDVLNANAVVPTRTETVTYDGQDYEMKINPNGTVYSICGTSGVKVYKTKDVEATDELFPRAEAIVDSEYPMFSSITVDGDRLYYNAYQVVDGKAVRVDSFAIENTENTAVSDKINEKFNSLVSAIFTSTSTEKAWKVTEFFYYILDLILNILWKLGI